MVTHRTFSTSWDSCNSWLTSHLYPTHCRHFYDSNIHINPEDSLTPGTFPGVKTSMPVLPASVWLLSGSLLLGSMKPGGDPAWDLPPLQPGDPVPAPLRPLLLHPLKPTPFIDFTCLPCFLSCLVESDSSGALYILHKENKQSSDKVAAW